MPYVIPERRRVLDDLSLAEVGHRVKGVGELTYVIYRILVAYIVAAGANIKFVRYADCEAALQCASKEFYRCHTEPYENIKREMNGDVDGSAGAVSSGPEV